jgi:hypothetical protein
VVSHWPSRYCHAAFRWRFWRMVVTPEHASKPLFISFLFIRLFYRARFMWGLTEILIGMIGVQSAPFLVTDLRILEDNCFKCLSIASSSFPWRFPNNGPGVQWPVHVSYSRRSYKIVDPTAKYWRPILKEYYHLRWTVKATEESTLLEPPSLLYLRVCSIATRWQESFDWMQQERRREQCCDGLG